MKNKIYSGFGKVCQVNAEAQNSELQKNMSIFEPHFFYAICNCCMPCISSTLTRIDTLFSS